MKIVHKEEKKSYRKEQILKTIIQENFLREDKPTYWKDNLKNWPNIVNIKEYSNITIVF